MTQFLTNFHKERILDLENSDNIFKIKFIIIKLVLWNMTSLPENKKSIDFHSDQSKRETKEAINSYRLRNDRFDLNASIKTMNDCCRCRYFLSALSCPANCYSMHFDINSFLLNSID